MFDLQITPTGDWAKKLDQLEDRLFRQAVAAGLTKTANRVRWELRDQMRARFDRPVPFTLNSVTVLDAKPDNPVARVFFREFANKGTPASKYLAPQMRGGARRFTKFEAALWHRGMLPSGMYAIPAKYAKLNAYGNISPGQVVKILSNLRAFGEQGYMANQRRDGKSKGVRRRDQYVVGGAHAGRPDLKPGIYERRGDNLLPVMIFVRGVHYKIRFPHVVIAQNVIKHRLPRDLASAIRTVQREAR